MIDYKNHAPKHKAPWIRIIFESIALVALMASIYGVMILIAYGAI